MPSRFSYCMDVIFKAEGKFSDNKADRGGATNYGVTQSTYNTWRIKMHLPQQSVKLATPAECKSLYLSEYWTSAKCELLPQPVDLVFFDMVVNSGQVTAAKRLQMALGVKPDGVIGPASRKAIEAADPLQLAKRFIDFREDFYEEITERDPSQLVFLKGWKNRLNHLREVIAA